MKPEQTFFIDVRQISVLHVTQTLGDEPHFSSFFSLLILLSPLLLRFGFASWICLTHEMSLIFFLEASIAVSLSCLLRCRFMIFFLHTTANSKDTCKIRFAFEYFSHFLCAPFAKWLYRMAKWTCWWILMEESNLYVFHYHFNDNVTIYKTSSGITS